MKYAVILCDGMADLPLASLNNATPMTVANKSCMNSLARLSEVGLVKTVADGLKPGSDVANLSVLGYDPAIYYSGRSPLEAASIGIDLKDDDVTFRCNLVTLSDEENYADKTMLDYCAGDISTSDAEKLIDYLQENLGDEEFEFYSGVSYRHCLVWSKGNPNPGEFTPPHDISDKVIAQHLPTGDDVEKIYNLMLKSYELLKNHPVNISRVENGKKPANSIWLWGEGQKPKLDSFKEKFGVKGSIISAVDLLKGIGICAKMNVCEVEGATGYIDTNYNGKVTAGIKELKRGQDFIYIHIEAPDECGHRGERDNKVKSLEQIDQQILVPLIDGLNEIGEDYAIMILPDHPTPLNIKTHTNDAVPYLIYRNNFLVDSNVMIFDEESASKTGNYTEFGPSLITKFFNIKSENE